MTEKSSWMRVAITIAIDWRFVIALVISVLALLLKQKPTSGEVHPSGETRYTNNDKKKTRHRAGSLIVLTSDH